MCKHIKSTKLFKRTVKICGLDKRKYAKELLRVGKELGINTHATTLTCAFLFGSSVQGFEFWRDIEDTCCLNAEDFDHFQFGGV